MPIFDLNGNRTGCSEYDKYVSYTCTTPLCEHRSQWAYDVKFWIFKKRIWFCDDCKAMLDAKGKVIG